RPPPRRAPASRARRPGRSRGFSGRPSKSPAAMPLPRRPSVTIAPVRPSWLTAGMLRLAALSAFVVAVGMIRGHLTTTVAWVIVGVGAVLALIGLAALLGFTRYLE